MSLDDDLRAIGEAMGELLEAATTELVLLRELTRKHLPRANEGPLHQAEMRTRHAERRLRGRLRTGYVVHDGIDGS